MRIDPKLLQGGNLEPAWTSEDANGVAFRVRYAKTSERRKALLTADGEIVGREAAVQFWLDRVTDWRGLEDTTGKPIAFTREALEGYLELHADSINLIVEEAQELSRFLGQPEPAATASAS